MSEAAFKDEELEGLSEEERLALQEDDQDESEELENEDSIDDENKDDDDLEGDDSADEPSKEDDEGEKDPDPVDESQDETQSKEKEFIPQYQPEEIENYDEKVKGFSENKTELLNKFNDGDIDMAEYQEQRDVIEKDMRDLEMSKMKVDMAIEQNSQANEQRWQWEQDKFFGQDVNTRYKENSLLGTTFDTAVKQLAADDKNEGKDMSWFLEEADRMVRSMLNESPNTNKPPKNKPPKNDIPPNLGNLPAADQADIAGDEFAKLDKLNGLDLEAALSKMSLTEQDRYLKG